MKIQRDLRKRIFNASFWTVGGHATSQILRLASNLLMTRLLMPDAFGVMAIANVFIAGLALFSDVGLGQNIVHSKRGNEQGFLNTVWTIQILRGAVICVLASMVAGLLYMIALFDILPSSSVYASNDLPVVLIALSISAFIGSFISTKFGQENRSLELKTITKIELICQSTALLFMVCIAMVYKSIWVLVYGAIFATIVKVTLSHYMFGGEKNKIFWDKKAVTEIFDYGKWIFLSSILGFLSTNADKFILAVFMNSTEMGIYSIATYLLASLQQIYYKICVNVAFPAACEIYRNSPVDLKKSYYKLRVPFDVSTIFISGFLFAMGGNLVKILYDDRYLGSGHMLEVLSLMLFESRFGLAGQFFLAIGKSKLLTWSIVTRLIAMAIIIPLGFMRYGVDGAIWASVISLLLTIPVTIALKIKNNLFDIKRELIFLPILPIGYWFGNLFNSLYVSLR